MEMQKYCVVFCVQISLVDIIHSRNSFKWKTLSSRKTTK